MKLKHYYKRYVSQLREAKEDLEELACKTLVSKILNNLGTSYPVKQIPKPSMNYVEIASLLAGQKPPVSYLPYILQNIGARPNDYLKFYILDTFTNQLYIDLLINMACYCYRNGIHFIFDFDLDDFTGHRAEPSISIEYQVYGGTEYSVSAIIYRCPFNGDMEMEDFQSLLLDSLYILNPEQCLLYLTRKLMAGVTTIPYSQNKEIEIIPCNGGIQSPIDPYMGIVRRYRNDNIPESFGVSSPIMFSLTNTSQADFKLGAPVKRDVSQLLGMLG